MRIHTTNLIRVVAVTSATGLVVASAGFGAVFAYKVGIQHSIVLAGLTVLMALALEGIKPLAVAAAFQAFTSLNLLRGLLLALLGLVAVAYSLTSELSLVSMSRGDMAAQRGSVAADEHELSRMAPARPSAEVQADIDALMLTPGADGCTAINGKVTQAVCPKVMALKAEKARADRKAELEGRTKGEVVQTADPGSTALVTYLAALGICHRALNTP